MSTSLRDFLGNGSPMERPWPPEVTHLSQSSIGMLSRCPRQFGRRYLHHEKERPGESLVVGSFLHETLDFNYQQKVGSGTDLPLSDVIGFLHDVAVPRVLAEAEGAENVRWDTTPDKAIADAERMTSAYTTTVVPRIQPVGTEFKFDLDFEGLPVPVIGYIDVWEAERTLDTKTGKNATTKVKPSWRLQGNLYSLATGRPTEFHSISRAAQPRIVTALESEEMVIPVPTPGQRENMTRVLQNAAALISYYFAEYGYEDWPALGAIPDFTRNMLPCDYCGWRKGCPAWT